MKKLKILTGILISLLFVTSMAYNARASENLQNLATPTPGPDGRIIYIVQEGQNCTMISTIAGIPVSQLRSLNRLDENCTIHPGQELLIGMGGPLAGTATPTGAPQASPTVEMTPTPSEGDASICVLLYDDLNGDALHQDTEGTIADGAISISGTSGQYSQTATTTSAIEPVCFEKVFQGTYNISVAAPEGYNPTTQQNYTLEIKNGEQIYVDFGAQPGGDAAPAETTPEPGNNNNLFGIIGGVMVVAAAGLGIYAWLVFGRQPKL